MPSGSVMAVGRHVVGGLLGICVGVCVFPGGAAAAAVAPTDQAVQQVVPQLVGLDVASAYAKLHQRGFGVSIPRAFELAQRPTVVSVVSPSPGTHVNAGTVVTLSLRCLCRMLPAVPRAHGRIAYRLPDFRRHPVETALRWANRNKVALVVHFAPLRAGYAASLFQAYRVSREVPRPATIVRLSRRRKRLPSLALHAEQRPLALHVAHCGLPPYSAIQGQDAEAVVYSTPQNAYTTLLSACLLATGATQQLGSSSYWTSYEMGSVGLSALAGHYAALLSVSEDKADLTTGLAVADLTTGQQVSVGPQCDRFLYCPVGQVVINSSGLVAWHQTTSTSRFALSGLSCPSNLLCVAVDRYGNVLSSTNPAGGPSAWTKAPIEASGLVAVSCATTTLCVAVDGRGDAFVSTNPTGGPSAWTRTVLQRGDALTAVSCTEGLCAAADHQGQLFTSIDPGSSTGTWTSAAIDSGRSITGISCPSSSLCVADDGEARVLTSTAPTGGASAWTATPVAGLPSSDNSLSLSSVSCYSTSFCVASGRQLDAPGQTPPAGGRVVESTNPTGGASAWSTSYGPTPLTTPAPVSCASTTLCVMTDAINGVVVSTNPATPQASWSGGWLGAVGSSVGLSCPAADLCVSADDSGHISTSANPSGGPSTWATSTVDAPDCTNASGWCTVEQIYAHDSSGAQLIDHTERGGNGTSLTQLNLTGNALTWTHDGAAESTALG